MTTSRVARLKQLTAAELSAFCDARVLTGEIPDRLLAALAGKRGTALKTHCPKGHPYDSANTRIDRQGWRHCRACHRRRSEARRNFRRGARQEPAQGSISPRGC